jgi:hypothetical protein
MCLGSSKEPKSDQVAVPARLTAKVDKVTNGTEKLPANLSTFAVDFKTVSDTAPVPATVTEVTVESVFSGQSPNGERRF